MAGLELFQRHRAAFLDGQAQVEGILNFIKERVALEETYSKSLLKLSKHTLSIDEKTTEPTIFEALASVRGDVANESVQHTELSSSLQRDVLDPLIRLRDGGEAVHKLSTQTKQAAKDMKAAYEKCRKLYSKYVQLHNKAVGACSSAGIPSPSMWIPPSTSSSSSSSSSTTTTVSTSGTTPTSNSACTTDSSSTGTNPTVTRSPTFTNNNSSNNTGGGPTPPIPPNLESIDNGSTSTSNGNVLSFTSPQPARSTGTFITPPPTVTTGVMVANSEGGINVQFLGDHRTGTTMDNSNYTSTTSVAPLFIGIDSDESIRSTSPSGTATYTMDQSTTPNENNFGTSPSLNGGGLNSSSSSSSSSSLRSSENSINNVDSIDGIIHVEETNSVTSDQHNSTTDSILHQQNSGSISQSNSNTGFNNAANRRRSVDEGSEGSFASLGDPNASFADRLRSMASGLIGSAMAVPPTTAAANAASNMTTEERIAAIKASAVAAVGLADEACRECQEAWIQHGKTKEVFQRQLTASMVIFTEIEKKRVAELSDSLRKYAVFISSLHANLQYDVQRLSGKVEEIANAPATTLTSLSAWKEQEQQQLLAQQLQAQQEIEQLQQIETSIVTTPMLNSLPEAVRRTSILDVGLSSTISSTTSTTSTSALTRSSSIVNATNNGNTNIPIERSLSNRSVGGLLDSPSSPPTFSKIGNRVLNAIPSVPSLGSFGTHTNDGSSTVSGNSIDTPLTPTSHTATVSTAISSVLVPTTVGISSSFVTSTAALFMNTTSITSPGPSSSNNLTNATSSSHDSNNDLQKSSVSMSRIFGAAAGRTNKPATSSPLVPRPNPDTSTTPERSTPVDISSPNGQLGAMMKGMLGSFGLGTTSTSATKTSSTTGKMSSSTSSTPSTSTPSSGGHPPLKPKQPGMSVSVSVLGSVRNHGIAGVGTKGTKEVAAMMEHLHIERGPIEFLVESLFDPTSKILKVSSDGSTITLELPNAQVSGESDGESNIPSLSLADFASGKSTPQSPTSGRSRVGTAASLSVETMDDTTSNRASPSLPDNPRKSPTIDNLHSETSGTTFVQPSSSSFATPQRDTSHTNFRMSPAVLNGELNSATLILLPKAKKLLQTAPDGLSRLVIALDSRRGESPVLTRPSFDALSTIILIALNIAEARSDFARARALMVISQTFYCYLHADEDADTIEPSVRAVSSPDKVNLSEESIGKVDGTTVTWTGQSHTGLSPEHRSDTSFITHSKTLVHTPEQSNNVTTIMHNSNGRSTRLYLQTRVKHHSLWQNMSYWESAVYDSVGSEISKLPSETKNESKGREQDIIFGQLGFFAYNMISFDVPEDSVRKLVDKYARFIHLDAHHTTLLMASMETFTKH